jgi:phosphatidylglycerol lysyltransferase
MNIPHGIHYYPARTEMPAHLEDRLRRLACRYGDTYASYLVTEPDWETLWSRDHRGVLRFVRWGGAYAMVVGGILAPAEDREGLLADFLQLAKMNRWHVAFYNIDREQLPLFRRHGFQITKFGEEPVVRLDKTDWKGKDYEWLRRQEKFCQRQGVQLVEVNPDPNDPQYRRQIAPELEAISREHIASTLHGKEMRYFVGRFDANRLGDRRLFVAQRDGRIEAFVVCNPCLDGTMWAVEMYRRRPDATRGVIPFAVLQTMRILKEQGVTYCSLSLIPAVRCETAVTGDSMIARPGLVFWWRHLSAIFDFRGIYHFKSRFHPEYREMYIAARPKVTIRSMIAMGMAWGLIRFNPLRLIRRVLSQRQKSESRKSLAEPYFRPERVLRRISRTVPGNGRTVGQAASLPDGPAQPSSLPVGRIANPSHDESKPQPAAMQ